MTNREKIISIIDNDAILKSDAIILLEGDGLNRFEHAINLHLSGFSDTIVFSGGTVNYEYGSYPFDEIKPLIEDFNLVNLNLIHEDKSQNTKEQAIEIIKIVKQENWQKIILVASHYHQYRAYLTFLKTIQDSNLNLILYNSPVSNLKWFEKSRWGMRFDLLESEFIKIEKYMAQGDLSSYEYAIEYQQWKEKQH